MSIGPPIADWQRRVVCADANAVMIAGAGSAAHAAAFNGAPSPMQLVIPSQWTAGTSTLPKCRRLITGGSRRLS